jgi:hypothetical protein
MICGPSRLIATLVICGLLIPINASAQARHHAAFEGLGSGAKTTLIVAVLVTAVALIGVGVYFAVRQGHTVKGCVADGANGLDLQTESGQSFVLLGATTGLKAGERVKVTGARKKRVNGVTDKQSFIVDKLDKDYGACAVSAAHP